MRPGSSSVNLTITRTIRNSALAKKKLSPRHEPEFLRLRRLGSGVRRFPRGCGRVNAKCDPVACGQRWCWWRGVWSKRENHELVAPPSLHYLSFLPPAHYKRHSGFSNFAHFHNFLLRQRLGHFSNLRLIASTISTPFRHKGHTPGHAPPPTLSSVTQTAHAPIDCTFSNIWSLPISHFQNFQLCFLPFLAFKCCHDC